MGDESSAAVRITVEPAQTSECDIDPNVFGRFAEHIGGAMYPGVFEEYLRNGSFDVWNQSGSDVRSAFSDIERRGDVAYPWEPIDDAENAHLEQRVGGVRGRNDDEVLTAGEEIPDRYTPDPSGVTESRYQRVALEGGGTGGVRQRVALPDRRASSYDIRFSTRGTLDSCAVALEAPAEGDTPLARETVSVESEWDRHELELSLETESPHRHDDAQYGEYYLTFRGEGDGVIDIDWVMLVPADAIEGKYNPETVRLLREYNVTSLRWPGGNYASQYRWRNGVGPIGDRPVVPVLNWGGLDPDYLGTNEWLRFCELVDAEPYLTVPVWSVAGPDEAAKWVEYCNGSTETDMGALRAEHGYPDPWDVTWWGIGNEVWGSWQVGRTDAEDYAERYAEYHDAMRAVDPDIEIDACGIDPWFTLVHDGSREDVQLPADGGTPPVWNDVLFETASGQIEGIDVHRYTEGISDHTSESGARSAWLEDTGETPLGYTEILVNDPGTWDGIFEALRSVASDHGVEEPRITVGEWGLRSNEVDDDCPQARTGTMAHAVFAVRALQAFVRNGRDVDLAHWTDFSLYTHPRSNGSSAVHPAARIYRDVAEPIVNGEREWHRMETEVSDAATRARPATGVSIPDGPEIELVDAVTIGTKDSVPQLQTIVVNGSLTEQADVEVDYEGEVGAVRVRLFEGVDADPFATGAARDEGYEVETFQSEGGESEPIELAMGPGSVAIVSSL